MEKFSMGLFCFKFILSLLRILKPSRKGIDANTQTTRTSTNSTATTASKKAANIGGRPGQGDPCGRLGGR